MLNLVLLLENGLSLSLFAPLKEPEICKDDLYLQPSKPLS